jgi:hypothetical protein
MLSRLRVTARIISVAVPLISPVVAQAASEGGVSSLAIQPMTRLGPEGSGYLADPQPIRLAPSSGDRVQMLSGTTKAIIRCDYPLRPGCFSWTPIRVTAGPLAGVIEAAKDKLTNIQNVDIFQDDQGGWQAAVTIGVKSETHPKHWTIIAHARPLSPGTPQSPPLEWAADTILVGSFTRPGTGNYDGKYFEDEGRLYLLYVDSIAPPPVLRNAIFLQHMRSPTELAPEPRMMLLKPGDRNGPLASENYGQTQAKLVEAPYLSKIGGKYALVYSTGAYLTPGYKTGVAWSDTLAPPPGGLYRKVLRAGDGSGSPEVRYLVQSVDPRWPNFSGGVVIGPGVAAAVQAPADTWWLYFNGFAPDDIPRRPDGQVEGDHRRPFYLPLKIRVPSGQSAGTVSDDELATWLTPDAR